MKITMTTEKDYNVIDLDNIMEYGGCIHVKGEYATPDGKLIRGWDFTVLDKDGNTIPECIAAYPKRRAYEKYQTDESGKMVATYDGEYHGILSAYITDENIQVVYSK